MSKIAKSKKKPKEPLKVEYMVNEPNVAYVTTTDLKNRSGEVLDLALLEDKTVILKKHGRKVLKIERLEEKKKLSAKEINELFAGSIPDLEIDPEFRKGFKFREFDID